MVPLVIALFKAFNEIAWIFSTFKTVGRRFFLDTILYFTFTAMLWFSLITYLSAQRKGFYGNSVYNTPCNSFYRGGHTDVNFSFSHFHSCLSLSANPNSFHAINWNLSSNASIKPLLPVRLSFYSQQFNKIIKQSCIRWLKHQPFSVVIGFSFIIDFLNVF